jgi:hypothetical protein
VSSFERVWAGSQEVRLRAVADVPAQDEPVVAAFRAWSSQLMIGAGMTGTPRSLDLRKLRLTEGYRETLRQAPGEQIALFEIWDAAYRVLEHLHWRIAPPTIDPPPPPPSPTFEEVRRLYQAMKRERARQAEAATVHWHPLEVSPSPGGPHLPNTHDE